MAVNLDYLWQKQPYEAGIVWVRDGWPDPDGFVRTDVTVTHLERVFVAYWRKGSCDAD